LSICLDVLFYIASHVWYLSYIAVVLRGFLHIDKHILYMYWHFPHVNRNWLFPTWYHIPGILHARTPCLLHHLAAVAISVRCASPSLRSGRPSPAASLVGHLLLHFLEGARLQLESADLAGFRPAATLVLADLARSLPD
jgi:hypothetical protein